MINKRTFIFDTLTEVLNYKIGMDARNETYIIGSFSAQPQRGEPDIPYYSRILIRETNQVWESGQFWLNDVHRDADNDLVTEHAERVAADARLQQGIDNLNTRILEHDTSLAEIQNNLSTFDESLSAFNSSLTSLQSQVQSLAPHLITMEEYRAMTDRKFQIYYVARNSEDKAKVKCWRIYLRNQLIGEFESSDKLTLPKFPMRFPFRFA